MDNQSENLAKSDLISTSDKPADTSVLPSPVKQEKIFDEFPTMIGVGGGGSGEPGDSTHDFSRYEVDNFSILKPSSTSSTAADSNQPSIPVKMGDEPDSSKLLNFTMDFVDDPSNFVIPQDSNDSHQVDLDFEIADNLNMTDSPSHNLSLKSDDFVNSKSDISFDLRSVPGLIDNINDEKFDLPEMNTSIMSNINETSMSQSDILDNLDSLEHLDKIDGDNLLQNSKSTNLTTFDNTDDLVPIVGKQDDSSIKDIVNLDSTPVQLNSSNEISSDSSLNDTKIESQAFLSSQPEQQPMEFTSSETKKDDYFGTVPEHSNVDTGVGDLQYNKNVSNVDDFHIGTVQQDNIDHNLQHQEMEFETDHFDELPVCAKPLQSAGDCKDDNLDNSSKANLGMEEVSTSFSTFTPVFESASVAELVEQVVLPKESLTTSDNNIEQHEKSASSPSPYLDHIPESNEDVLKDAHATTQAQVVSIQPDFVEEFVVDRPSNVQQFIESPLIDEKQINVASFGLLSHEPSKETTNIDKYSVGQSTTLKTLSDSTEFEKITDHDLDDYMVAAPSAPQSTIVEPPKTIDSHLDFDDFIPASPSAPLQFVEPTTVSPSSFATSNDYHNIEPVPEQQQQQGDLVSTDKVAVGQVDFNDDFGDVEAHSAVDLKADLPPPPTTTAATAHSEPVDRLGTPTTPDLPSPPPATATFEAPQQVQPTNYDLDSDLKHQQSSSDDDDHDYYGQVPPKGTGNIEVATAAAAAANLLYTSPSLATKSYNVDVEDEDDAHLYLQPEESKSSVTTTAGAALIEEQQQQPREKVEKERHQQEVEEEEVFKATVAAAAASISSSSKGDNTLEELDQPASSTLTPALTSVSTPVITRPQQSPPPPPTTSVAAAASSFSFSSSPTLDTTSNTNIDMARKNFKRDNSNESDTDSGPDNLKEFLNIVLGPCVAELLYWRDPKQTGPLFALGLIFLFSLSSFSVISVVAYTLFFTLLGTLSFRVYKNVLQAVQKTSEGHPFGEYLALEITPSQERIHEIVDQLLVHVNCLINRFRSVLLVEDIVDSLKYLLIFWSLTYIGAWFNGLTLVLFAYLGAFSLPKVYELNKSQIDQYIELASSKINEICDKLPFLKKAAVAEKKDD